MKFFRRPLGKKKPKKGFLQQQEDEYAPTRRYLTPPQGSQPIKLLPDALIERIFTFVCPHTQDETYETCEQAAEEQEGCMLCDLRDLSHCAKVSRKWRALASKVMYHSIRIDAVHYCRLEEILAEKRKRKSKFNRNGEPENIPQVRLQLLSRTLRENVDFGPLVQYLKIPIMTRETSKADLARTVAVLPNLKYVDLPDGFFTDESSCHTLKQELQGRCPDIRKMTFAGGGERSLESLATAPIWRNLEVLELTRLNMDPTILRQVLGYLPLIRALKVTDMKNFNDELLEHSDYLPPFPALTELIFQDTPNVTADGLSSYLFRTDTQSSLNTLSLTATGVHPSTLQNILCTAPALLHLSITETVTTSFPASSNIQPLASDSLRTFHYEITSGSSANAYANTTASYYAYLTSSLLRNGLPNLHSLYVRDPDFPESLIDLAPPIPAFAHDPDNFSPSPPKSPFDRPLSTFSSKNPFAAASDRPLSTFSSNNPFASNSLPSPQRGLGLKQPLEVYSKGLDEMEWNFATVQPPTAPGRRGSMTNPRPISSYGLAEGLGKQWAEGGGARRSVIVGNGFGGYLAVPAEELQRPSSSAGEKGGKRGSRYDMWR